MAKKDEGSQKASKVKTSKREISAGGAVFKKRGDKILWLIIKPAGKDRWQFPKGLIDKGEKEEETAIREVEEEGGVKVKLIKKIKDINYFYFFEGQRVFKTVKYYLMEFEGSSQRGHDEEVDEVKFLEYEEAYKLLTFKNDKDVLKEAKIVFDRGIQENLI